ncbi:tyrosine-type recombinase/integrase [Pedobacter sp. MC2016-05]|uniref:site-specific integrase n=1 Tax=Pedobacter sp. MC2016-05 TaxID=2994474 RepID=UPI002247BBA9|nr:site-specific integrase [Pedobacter sp. MC2016-05]MCX2473584.1 tyrosine-type recombinase/integrase [Pedobacter sp. MC2016-05]
MVSYSVKLKGNLSRIKKNGEAALYLQVIINREVRYIGLDLTWPADFIDNKTGQIKSRSKKDKDHSDYMLIITNELTKINEIFKVYRIQDTVLTMESFNYELSHTDRRKDFIVYMELKLQERRKYKVIEDKTYVAGMGTVKRLRQFRNSLPFHGLTKEFFQGFAAFLKKKGNAPGTVWTRLKDVKSYIHHAEEDNFQVPNDYRKFKSATFGSSLVYLEEDELTAMVDVYNSNRLVPELHKVLRAFLFSCFTSIRISDVQRANWEWMSIDRVMRFIPWKGRRFRKVVEIPVSQIALSLIEHKNGNFFSLPTDQEINRTLKDIVVEVNKAMQSQQRSTRITKNLTFHVSRHTFGTHYYRQTKDVVTLQKIMGHSKIGTTMIYVHVSDTDKREGIETMNSFFVAKPAYLRVVS